MSGNNREKLRFPKIEEVRLMHFSLYEKSKGKLSIPLTKGATCFVGANGIGKSTLLCTINYGLTGRVPLPQHKFESVEEYHRESGDFVRNYFEGRIAEDDRNEAEVHLRFTIKDKTYELRRSLFSPNELRYLRIADSRGEFPDLEEKNDAERNIIYENQLTRDIGLAAFDQFVFLQHYVFTFDERRHLLFWNPRVLQHVLYLTFGMNLSDARDADKALREWERADSRIRNLTWQIKGLRTQINEKRKHSGVEVISEEVEAEYTKLYSQLERAREAANAVQAQLDDAQLRLNALAATIVQLKSQYEEEFTTRLKGMRRIAHHPLITTSIEQKECALCGTAGKNVVPALVAVSSQLICPLCQSPAAKGPTPAGSDLVKLKRIDAEMLKVQEQSASLTKTAARRKSELEKARVKEQSAQAAVAAFEELHPGVSNPIPVGEDAKQLIAALQQSAESFSKKRTEQVELREQYRKELRRLTLKLGQMWQEVETSFVRQFSELAEQFLGVGMDVKFETVQSSSQPNLVLVVDEKERRKNHELSESQRFFVDIALRMACIIQMTEASGAATLFLDTPEGSLDIAYESRAGQMLATFVQRDHLLVMTANINTSRLLHVLAETLKSRKLEFVRMTSWAELTEVQIEEESLFDKAYSELTSLLKGRARS